MDTLKAVHALFVDWDSTKVDIRPDFVPRSVLVGLGLELVGREAEGRTAGEILNRLALNRHLSLAMVTGGQPTLAKLLDEFAVLVKPIRGWSWVATDDLPEQVSIAELVRATQLAGNTVREQIRKWVRSGALRPVEGFGEHGALRYPLDDVRTLVREMPGSGNRTPRKAR